MCSLSLSPPTPPSPTPSAWCVLRWVCVSLFVCVFVCLLYVVMLFLSRSVMCARVSGVLASPAKRPVAHAPSPLDGRSAGRLVSLLSVLVAVFHRRRVRFWCRHSSPSRRLHSLCRHAHLWGRPSSLHRSFASLRFAAWCHIRATIACAPVAPRCQPPPYPRHTTIAFVGVGPLCGTSALYSLIPPPHVTSPVCRCCWLCRRLSYT